MITTLILGAGTSKAYGYPTGAELLEEVKRVLSKDKIGPDTNIARRLTNLGIESLDAYMNLDQEAGPRLKRVIAEIIHGYENENAIDISPELSPYALFLRAVPPEKYENFRIVSFNYDRSLEFFLARGIMSLKNCNNVEAFGILKKLKIVHVHGRLSNLPGETGYENRYAKKDMGYGYYKEMMSRLNSSERKQQFWIEDELKSSIYFHGQESLKNCFENSGVCEPARAAIEESERVCFMGFGFHESNMKALGYTFNKTGSGVKRVYGTTWEASGNDFRRVKEVYPEIHLVTDCTAAGLLRNFVDLANPDFDFRYWIR